MVRDGGSHRLHKVLDVVELRVNNRAAECLKTMDVQRDVVVDDENRARAVLTSIADIGKHAVERVSMKVAAAHLDDGAETAVEGAAARGLDHIDLLA